MPKGKIIDAVTTKAGHPARIRRPRPERRLWVVEEYRLSVAAIPRKRPDWYGYPYSTLREARAALSWLAGLSSR